MKEGVRLIAGRERREYISPRLRIVASPIRLPILVRLVLGILQGGIVLVMSVILFNRWAYPAPIANNPFISYADYLPGQVSPELDTHGFLCISQNTMQPNSYTQTSCVQYPTDSIFENVRVTLSADHIVMDTTFTIAPESLRVGDLVPLWGRPTYLPTAKYVMTFDWPGTGWTVLVHTDPGEFSYFMTLQKVTFIATW